jgi:hypothetical protein
MARVVVIAVLTFAAVVLLEMCIHYLAQVPAGRL